MNEFPQLVPQNRCLRCDVCCRFPDFDSPLRPYFTRDEISAALARGIPLSAFPDENGGKINLIPHPEEEGFICPAFDPATSHCKIYPVRPLDCQIYPLAITESPTGGEVLLGWDQKCPYLREETDRTAALAVAEKTSGTLQNKENQSILEDHPGLIGAYQEDVWILEPLQAIPSPGASPTSPDPSLTLLSEDDYSFLMTQFNRTGKDILSSQHPASLLMWTDLFKLWRTDRGDELLIVAEQKGTFFLPTPPVGDDLVRMADEAMNLLNRLNTDPSASRIERLSEKQGMQLESAGFEIRKEAHEYLYEQRELADLPGKTHKSHRWDCNQIERRFHPSFRPYTADDFIHCLRLYAHWRAKKDGQKGDPYASALRADSFYAHSRVLAKGSDWDLTARVAVIDGKVAAYTAGAPINKETFLILLEISDPDYPGLGPYLFREFCKELKEYRWINTMDDSGLDSLRRVKKSYRPFRLIPFYSAFRKNSG